MLLIQNFGVDLGTLCIKTSRGDIFPSGISDKFVNLAINTLEVDGKKYRMGLHPQDSFYDVNIDKSRNQNLRLCYLYALVKDLPESVSSVTYDTVLTVLPFTQWENDETVQRYKKTLDCSKGIVVTINGRKIKLTVNNIVVTPEGFAAYESLGLDGKPTLMFDIGSRTMHVLRFNNDEFIEGYTEPYGILSTLQKLSNLIQKLCGVCIPAEDVPRILFDDYTLKVDEGVKNVAESVIDILDSAFYLMYTKVKTRFSSFDTIEHFVFIGGGSLGFEPSIRRYFKEPIIPVNAQTITAESLTKLVEGVEE